MQKLTSGNSSQLYPSITANKNNEIFILWYGVTVLTPSNQQIRKIKYSIGSWGSIQDITNNTVSGKQLYYPSTLVDFNINFSNPLFIYQNGVTPSINFYGTWNDISYTKLTLQSPITKNINDVIPIIPQIQKLKMKSELFDTFNSMDLNLYMNRMYKATVKTNASNSKNIDISATDKALYKGSKLWIANKENVVDNIITQLTTIDRQNTTVITGDYTTQGDGGRKLVRLDDGTLVCAAIKVVSTTYYLMLQKSLDNGLTWVSMGERSSTTTVFSDVALVTDGKRINVLLVYSSSQLLLYNLSKNDLIQNITHISIESSQTAIGNCSLAINEAKTELHACWSSKNSTYPDSFNIRYAKGTINSDGTVTWGTVEYVDKYNTTGTNMMNPSIIVTSSNIPIIFYEFASSSANQFAIGCRYRNPSNSNWEVRSVMATTNRNQLSPSAIYVPSSVTGTTNGRIWVAWMGADATDTVYNIRVSYSDDLGTTWSATTKLTSGNTYGQGYTSITANKNNEVFVVWHGYITGSWNSIRKIKFSNGTWGAIENVTNQTNSPHHYHPSTLVDFNINFTSPLFIYTQHQTKIGFYGKWEDFGGYALTMKDAVTLSADDKLPIIDMEVKQDNQALPLIAVDDEKFMYKSTIPSTTTSKIEVLGSENKVESVVYAIA
jgi:hypothetical protein